MDRIESFRAVVGALHLPALIIARGRRILCMNAPAGALLGHDASGAHYSTVLRQPGVMDAIEGALDDGSRRDIRFTAPSTSRDQLYRINISGLMGSAQTGVLLVFEDISGAEGLGQMRRDFVANVSHELRTPLTALSGFIETLRGAARNDPKAAELFLGMMDVEAGRMNRLVQDLLSLSRVESEARVVPDQRLDVVDLVQETAQTLVQVIGNGEVDLQLDLPDHPIWVMGSRDQLTQVFRNLIENATKYGGGRVAIKASLPAREPALRGPAIIFDVQDNGEGIETHHLPRLTERFYRIDTHRSREKGGTGLGLAIAKHVIGRHRGRLRISSQIGEGSTFSVVLPRLSDE